MFNPAYCGAYANLFSNAFLARVAKGEHHGVIASLIRRSRFESKDGLTLAQFLNAVYGVLSKQYRCEYVYKNVVANRLLLDRYPDMKAVLFSEFGVLSSKADIVIVNGTTSAYEIKTELDSLLRLKGQIENYCMAFDLVSVVTCDEMLSKASVLLSPSIGILRVHKGNQIEIIREPISNASNLRADAIFNCLRREEYLSIIERETGERIHVPSGFIYRVAKEKFLRIPSDCLHSYFVETLQRRTDIAALHRMLLKIPRSLSALILGSRFTQKQYGQINEALNSPVL